MLRGSRKNPFSLVNPFNLAEKKSISTSVGGGLRSLSARLSTGANKNQLLLSGTPGAPSMFSGRESFNCDNEIFIFTS